MKYELEFTLEKLTKNTKKFAEKEVPGKPPVLGSLYIAKWAAGEAKTVKVTLEIPE